MQIRYDRRTFISAQIESRTPLLRPLAWPSAHALSHALWYGRSVRAQLLIVFILIDVIAGLIAGAVTILQARTSTRVEIAASMELAGPAGERGGGAHAAGSAGGEVSCRPHVAVAAGSSCADRGEGRRRLRTGAASPRRRCRRDKGSGARLVCGADRCADRKPRCAGHRQRSPHRLGRDRRRAARRDRGGLGQHGRARRGGADREHRCHRHSLFPVRSGARPAHRRRPRPRRPRAAQLPGPAAAAPRAGARRHHRPLQCARAGARRRSRRERDAQPSADHGAGRRAAPHRARAARRSRPEPVRPQGQCGLDRDRGGGAAGAGGEQE